MTTTALFAWETIAPLVVDHSGNVLNLIGNFYHVLEDIVAETAITSTADEMLDAANVWLKEARGERSIDIADIASITRGMLKQLSGGDRLERKVIYTTLVEIIERVAKTQASKAEDEVEDEDIKDYNLAGHVSESDGFIDIEEDGSGDNANTEDDDWSMVSSR